MKHILRFFAVLLLLNCISILSLSSQVKEYVVSSSGKPSDIERLAQMLAGNYSSVKQAEKDTAYRDIRMHIKRIWQNRTDGVWFYVEQAVATKQDKPYRQRIYRLTQTNDSTFENAVYTLPNPLRFTGEWKKLNLLYSLTPDSLSLRNGCSVILHARGNDFEGNTDGKNCSSDLQGAAYANSQVTVTPKMLLSWDRGYTSSGELVWGEAKGPYQFIRQK